MTPCFVPRGGVLYTMIVLGERFLPPSSRTPGVCPGGVVMDEIDACIRVGIKWSGPAKGHFQGRKLFTNIDKIFKH